MRVLWTARRFNQSILKPICPGCSLEGLMLKLVLEKSEGPEIKLPTFAGSSKKAREFQKNIYFCFIDYAKAFECVDHKKLENSERDENGTPPDLSLEKPVCRLGSNS